MGSHAVRPAQRPFPQRPELRATSPTSPRKTAWWTRVRASHDTAPIRSCSETAVAKRAVARSVSPNAAAPRANARSTRPVSIGAVPQHDHRPEYGVSNVVQTGDAIETELDSHMQRGGRREQRRPVVHERRRRSVRCGQLSGDLWPRRAPTSRTPSTPRSLVRTRCQLPNATAKSTRSSSPPRSVPIAASPISSMTSASYPRARRCISWASWMSLAASS